MRRILVIGVAGYVGTVLTDHLLQQGYIVRCFDNFLYKNNDCISSFLRNKKYQFTYGDICSPSDMSEVFDEVTDVVLLAGLVGDPITKKYPKQSRLINELGIENVINLADGKGTKRFIFVSTCSNYGMLSNNEIADEEFSLNPLSDYARAKVKCEKYLMSLFGTTDFKCTILRFATAFGLSPRMRFDLTISEFTKELVIGNELTVFDANTWRPYCHVRDFARLIQTVLEAKETSVANQIFNEGGDENNYTKKMIVDEISHYIPKAKIKFLERGSDPRNYRVNFGKVRNSLNFQPKYSVTDGIKELLITLESKVFKGIFEEKNVYGNYEIDYKNDF